MNPILKFAVVLVAAAAAQIGAGAEAFADRLAAAKHDPDKAEAILEAWRKAEPDKPERLVAAANYWWRLGTAIRIDASKKKEEIELLDENGKRAGSIGPGFDPGFAAKAVAALREGTAAFPDRLDIWCGLSHLLQESKNPKDQLDVLKAMVAHAKQAKPGALRWMDAPLDAEPGEFVADKVHAYGAHYYRMENEFGDQAFGAIVGLLNKEFPEFAVGWNDQALYQHFIKRDTKAAIAALEKAHALSPDDYLIVFNIAKFAALSGDKPKAVAWFTKVIEKSGDEDLSANAKEEIAALEKGES